MANLKLSMEEMKEDVKNLCSLQLTVLKNYSNLQLSEEIILETLTGAYIAGVNKGLNMSREIEKEFSL